MKTPKRVEVLIRKLFTKKISEDELNELNTWYSSDFEKEKVEIFSRKDQLKDEVKMRMFERLKNEIEISKYDRIKNRYASPNLFRILSAAAIITLMITTGYFIYNWSNMANIDNTEFITKTVKRGEKSKLTLVDGTVIWLNSESVLKFPTKFNSDRREIKFEGEGHFEVARNENYPFIIKTAKTTTTVLGTSFNIRAYKNEPTKITVTSGKVNVKTPNLTATANINNFLIKNDQVTYDVNSGETIVKKVNSADLPMWTKGLLVFDGNNLNEVAQIIERWFDVHVEIKNYKSTNSKFYGQYDGEKLYNILESLKFTLDIKYTSNKKNIIIDAENCK